MPGPNPNAIHPNENVPSICYIWSTITRPNILAGEYTEQLRKTQRGKELYAMRKQTIKRVFADAKEKHAMRYTHHRSLAAVTR